MTAQHSEISTELYGNLRKKKRKLWQLSRYSVYVTDWTTEESWFESCHKQGILFFSKRSRLTLQSTQSPIQLKPQVLFQVVKRLGNAADPSLLSGDEMKNAWSSNLTRPYAIAACARTMREGGGSLPPEVLSMIMKQNSETVNKSLVHGPENYVAHSTVCLRNLRKHAKGLTKTVTLLCPLYPFPPQLAVTLLRP